MKKVIVVFLVILCSCGVGYLGYLIFRSKNIDTVELVGNMQTLYVVGDEIDFEDANQEMQSLVENWLGMELYQTVSSQFSNFAFFGLSALGSNPDMDNKIPKFRPFRVADPFLWILMQEKIVPKL